MFGNMNPAGATGGMANMPTVPPVVGQVAPTATGMGGNVAGGGNNPISMLMKALFSPDEAAADMAKMGVTPEDLSKQMQSGNRLSTVMGANPNAKQPTAGDNPVPFSFSRVAQDLLKPIGGPSEAASAGIQKPTLSQLMNPIQQGQQEQQIQNQVQRSNDILAPSGQNIMQPGPDHPGISAATPDNFITISDILSKIFGGGSSVGATPEGVMKPPVVPPVVSPEFPKVFGQQPDKAMPINPPVVPPPSDAPPSSVDIADYTSGKIKSGVMGSAGGNAPDSQLKGNSIFNEFMGTIKAGGITNPNALAAIAATTKSESGFSEKNFYGSWNDPSEKGVSGTSGGAMSWRNERFQAMKDFVKANGGDPNKPSAALQAKFFLSEDPNLIAKLNAAKSPEEAQTLMNNAWKFAGYDNPAGGEAARRIALARNFAASGSFGDLSGIIPAADGGTAGAAYTPPAGGGTGELSLMDRLAMLGAGGDGSGSSSQPDLNLPDAPSPIGPRPGQYSPDPNMMKLMLMMLSPGGGGTAIPTLMQLMSGKGVAA